MARLFKGGKMKAVRMLKTEKGFSLIELMIVVAIIGILATVAIPNFQRFQAKARQSEGKGYLASLYSAEKAFHAEWNTYTSSMPGIGMGSVDGRGVYRVGFTNAAVAVAGTTILATDITSVAPTAAGGATIPAQTALPTTSYSASAFVAGTAGELYPGAAADRWTITNAKVITNTTSGL